MTAIPARARVSEHLARHYCLPSASSNSRYASSPASEATHRAAKLERQFAAEIEPENAIG
jgi:hypothetical protein